MELQGKVAVITRGARGIGAALARRFAAEGAAGVVVADLDERSAAAVATEIRDAGGPAIGTRADVSAESEVRELVNLAEEEFGRVDLFCSNAGIATGTGLEAALSCGRRPGPSMCSRMCTPREPCYLPCSSVAAATSCRRARPPDC
jgi:NAD(P)-dependent dehydrogenase (short-subunit alcohol dehydrogenase family)